MNQTYLVKTFVGVVAATAFLVSGAAFAQNVSSSCLTNLNLAVGSRGEEVYKLQRFLVDQGLLKVAPTGYYGPLTEQAVNNFEAKGLCEFAPRLNLISPNASIQIKVGDSLKVDWSSENYSLDNNITIVLRPKGLQAWVPSQNGAFAAIVKNDGEEIITPATLQEGEYSIRVLCTDVPHCVFDDSDGFVTVVDSGEQNTNASLSSQTQLASVLVGFQTLLAKFEEIVR